MSDIDHTRIGGSDVAAILGISPWRNAADVYHRIVDGVRFETNEAQQRGKNAEPAILASLAQSRGIEILPGGTAAIMEPLGNPKGREWQRVNLDGTTVTDHQMRIVEAKTASIAGRSDWGEPGTDRVPPYYMVQVQAYLEAYDVSRALVAVAWSRYGKIEIDPLTGLLEIDVYEVDASPKLQGLILERCERFWAEHVLREIPPEDLPSKATVDALYPKAEHEVMDVGMDCAELAKERERLKQFQKTVESDLERVERLLKVAIGKRRGIMGPWGRALWSDRKTQIGTDWEAVAHYLSGAASLSGSEWSALKAEHKKTIQKGGRTLRVKLAEGADDISNRKAS